MGDIDAAFTKVRSAGFKVIMLSETADGWMCTLAKTRFTPMAKWKTGRGSGIASAVLQALGLHEADVAAPTAFEDLI